MLKDDIIRLHHIIDSAKVAILYVQDKQRSSLDKERQLVYTLIKLIEIIGEAASKLTNECRLSIPQIQWNNIIKMRNRLIHAYFDIDLDILWKTVIEDIPPLIMEIERVLSNKKNR
jgi:uncharacterized protein with HEPN domain